ncbi:MAG: hypothetical protein COW84_06665, partial [Gammaproteobacteria bacterium CG22_combo_CG10-13_8_21_14_all_40_8]
IITEACQKNYTLIFTDGFANNLSNGPAVGNVDNVSDAYSGVTPYKDEYSNTLADIAMKYYDTNLRPDLTHDLSPIPSACSQSPVDPSLDCNSSLHMNTYAVGLNATGDIFGVTHHTVADAYATTPNWVEPLQESGAVQADDLYHAVINGRGEMFSATSPDSLKTELKNAVTEILDSASQGGASSVAFNTSTLKSSSVIMTASFNASDWSGELTATRLNATTGDLLGTAWTASSKLDALIPQDRYILTYNGSDGVLFDWANLTTAQKADLNTSPSGTADSNGSARLDYLRGVRTSEGSTYRIRSTVLGDIVHSSPVFVGEPELSYPDQAPFGVDGKFYSSFKASKADRDPVVYVGANDGMLHGFLTSDTATKTAGSEVFAYVPNALYSSSSATEGLHYLTDPGYVHKNYVDGTPIAADVYINSAWKTILIGSLRGGGRGFYALDVTDPADFTSANASSRVLWEFTNSDDASLGYVTGKPVVALMNNGQWAVVFGNGYGGTGTKLFIVYVDAGIDGSWTTSDYTVIDTGATGGLSQPALADLNADGIADRVYAGDVNGNMWVFDVSSSNASQWAVAYKQGNTPKPLFTAKNSAGDIQSITSSPVLAINPNVATINTNKPNILVLFGTGQYLVGGDLSNTETQSFYAVWDKGDKELLRAKLESRTIVNTGNFRTTTGSAVNWDGSGTTQNGWYMDFNLAADPGERVVLSPNVRSDTVFFNTLIPEAEACSAGGRGFLMSVNLADGLTPTNAVFDTNNDGVIDDSDSAYSGQLINNIPMDSGFLGDGQYTPTNVGTVEKRVIDIGETSRTGRLSWIEMENN